MLVPVVYPKIKTAEVEPPPQIPELHPGELGVLVVEDNKETAFLIESYLKRSEFRLTTVHSLSDARKILERLHPSAIVLDIILQGEPCWSFVKEIQERFSPPPPILAISVSPEATRALAAGANVFLQKPLDPATLLRHLRQLTVRLLQGKVLLIDDNEVARYLLRSLLPEASLEIVEARSGREGLQAAVTQQPSVIFLDLVMPDLSGFEVLHELRANERTRNTPVIIHSSHVLNHDDQAKIAYSNVVVWPKSRIETKSAAGELHAILGSLGMDFSAQVTGHHV